VTSAPVLPSARHIHSGKVRDLYELPDGRLLIVASDRVSAYDHVLGRTSPTRARS